MSGHSPRLGLLSATCLVIASMVGAGVFTTSGFALADLGSREWVLAAWLIGGVVAICGAVSYGALVRDLCESGGEYLFLSRRVHPVIGFLAGWISLVAGFTGAIAFAATTLAAYLGPLFPVEQTGQEVLQKTVAVVAIVACAAQHSVGLQTGARLQNWVVVAKLLLLAGLVAVGTALLLGRGGNLTDGAPAVDTPQLAVLCSSLTWIALAFSGFNAAVYVASDIDRAESNVPRAMLLGATIVAVLYLALNAVFVFAGPIDQLAGKQDVAALALELLHGPALATTCRVVVAIALLTSVSANLMAGPRVYDRMAADGLFPLRAAIGGVVPRGAIFVQAALAIVVVLASDLKAQLDFLGVLLSLSAAATVGSLFLHRPGQTTRLTPLVGVAAALFTVASLVFAGFALKHNYDKLGYVWVAVAATIGSGLLFYAAMRVWGRGNAD